MEIKLDKLSLGFSNMSFENKAFEVKFILGNRDSLEFLNLRENSFRLVV